jgi:N-acetylglucosaminyldiphosphoundecaprenol N-acetyl-beta-D-mannosaminyltransferase
MGLGGSLDVWSGNLRRAPLLIQKAGLEWLWRTVLEPKRARIFLDIPRFLIKALTDK